MTPGGERDERHEAFVSRVRSLVWAGAVEVSDTVRREDPIEGFRLLTRSRLDDPRAGIRAALLVRQVAAGQLYQQANEARAVGWSWEEIGEALELPGTEVGADRPRGEAAFEWLIEGREPEPLDRDGVRLFRQSAASWRCGSCGAQVIDRGPFESHPDDNESGHAEDCPRHRAAIAAWRAATGWEEQ